MLRVDVIAVGVVKDAGHRMLLDDYAKRLGRYVKFKEVELRDMPEGALVEKVQKRLPNKARLVALEVLGKPLSTAQLSRFLEKAEHDASRPLCFVIGGAYGLPKAISDKAELQLSLSAMTLPHKLARVLLFEQLYRSFSRLRGEPYDH